MKSFFNQWIKPAGLFLFGVFMIVWGYMANASNSERVQEKQDLSKGEDKAVKTEDHPVQETTEEDKLTESVDKEPVVSEDTLGKEKKQSVNILTENKAAKKEKAVKEDKKEKATPVVVETEKKAEEASGTE